MGDYLTPGVYYERVDAGPPGIAPLRTDIAGFVGLAPRGPLHAPVPIDSLRQFQAWFGEFSGIAYLAYTVRAFFENGGRRCWVVRIASDAAATARTALSPSGAPPRWIASANSPGSWGDALQVTIRETHRAQTRTVPMGAFLEASVVLSTAGFVRGTHVRLSQAGAGTRWQVVSDIDSVNRRLIWVHERPEVRLAWDRPLAGFDAARPITVESVEYTLIVREGGVLRQIYSDLSLVPEHPRYGPTVLSPPRLPRLGEANASLPLVPEPIVLREARALDDLRATGTIAPLADPLAADATEWPLRLRGGADGLVALRVEDFCGEPVDPLASDDERAAKTRGLTALAEVGEVAVVAVPDIHIQPVNVPQPAPVAPCVPDSCLPLDVPLLAPSLPRVIGELPPRFSEAEVFRVQSEMVRQCERKRDRIALLDPPYAAAMDERLGVTAVRAWRSRFDSTYAALYYPWLVVVDPLRAGGAITRAIPPCGHVAGQFARTDLEVGVHRAPANAPLAWVQGVSAAIDDATHGILNPLGVNAVRVLPGRGLRIEGARTVSSNPSFRYVNVRRLLMQIEKAIDVSLQWAVFEPNDLMTRAKLQLVLTTFLFTTWSQGALAGETASDAFFVRCDETLNPPAHRADGRLLALVGVAPARPLEFIVVRVGRINNGFEIVEVGVTALAGG